MNLTVTVEDETLERARMRALVDPELAAWIRENGDGPSGR